MRLDDADRRRLVRLCARISGDPGAAEDLAQETLLEAWRNRHKLHDASGTDRWLAAIARNVCLRRLRTLGREVPSQVETADVEHELDRGELVDLLDRALALLPAETRELLVERYVHDRPNSEIAARLAMSTDALAMRITRGKAVLRRLIAEELGDAGNAWRSTRVWCTRCGRATMQMRTHDGSVTFRCSSCSTAPSHVLGPDIVGGLVRPKAILDRAAAWSRRTFRDGVGSRVDCACGASLEVRRYSSGLFTRCDRCGEERSSSVDGLAVAQPAVRTLWRAHGRTRAVPRRQVEHEGVPATVARYESVRGSSGVDVILARDSLRVLSVV